MMIVRDVMTRDVLTVRPDTPLKDVAQLLVARGISGLPVVDVDGTVLGVVSEADLLVKEQGADAIVHRPLSRIRGEDDATVAQLGKLRAVTAGEAMTAPPITITPTRSIHEAAAVMTAQHVNRMPVLDDDRLVGIVTRADLIRAYVRSDEELATAIRQDVILKLMWLDPSTFTVVVEDGIVSIAGRVERRSTSEILERSIRLVPGVVDVRASVAWWLDDRELQPASLDPVFPFGPR
jgi:CBS domain-containing protein